MPAKLIISKRVDKNFLKLPKRIQEKVITSYIRISEMPLAGIKLHGELAQRYKYRIGDYRIVYMFDNKAKIVYVEKIEHRQGVYK